MEQRQQQEFNEYLPKVDFDKQKEMLENKIKKIDKEVYDNTLSILVVKEGIDEVKEDLAQLKKETKNICSEIKTLRYENDQKMESILDKMEQNFNTFQELRKQDEFIKPLEKQNGLIKIIISYIVTAIVSFLIGQFLP